MFGIIPFKTNSNNKGGSLEELFDDFFNDSFVTPISTEADKFKADIKEKKDEYVVSAELPGVKKEDISLDYEDNNLIVKAKREECKDESKDSYIRKERSYGEFSRAFYLDNVNREGIKAKFENGELKVILPKKIKKEEKHSKIEIQ